MEISIKEWNVNFGSDKDVEICAFANRAYSILYLLRLKS